MHNKRLELTTARHFACRRPRVGWPSRCSSAAGRWMALPTQGGHVTHKETALRSLTFGQRVAEEERDSLVHYFVSTDVWNRLFAGEVDVVYGPKGSGKSALYTLLNAKASDLFDRNVFLVPAENPRGATAFHGLVSDPPASEEEFRALWKLYFATLADSVFREYEVEVASARELRTHLTEAGLVSSGRNLAAILRSALDYVKSAVRPEGLEGGVKVDPATGLLAGFTGKITFREPSADKSDEGFRSVDALLQMANQTLCELDVRLWIGLDRLDVAFAETPDLEKNALRALFKVYLDLMRFDRVGLKIFLRSDIWDRIVQEGFREASHITRHATIKWDRRGLMSLIAERTVENADICSLFELDAQSIRGSAGEQEALFYRMCPDQVEVGLRKPKTFDWVLSRTQDSTGLNAPRELIHFMNSLRDEQVRRTDTGEPMPEGDILFSRLAFKEALPAVSRVRLEQTLYAEHPGMRACLELLRGEKTSQSASSLAVLWNCSEDEAHRVARELVEVGFFDPKGDKSNPDYWVPFLYRDALDMVQGSAESD